MAFSPLGAPAGPRRRIARRQAWALPGHDEGCGGRSEQAVPHRKMGDPVQGRCLS
jgi:hypothetical protein